MLPQVAAVRASVQIHRTDKFDIYNECTVSHSEEAHVRSMNVI